MTHNIPINATYPFTNASIPHKQGEMRLYRLWENDAFPIKKEVCCLVNSRFLII